MYLLEPLSLAYVWSQISTAPSVPVECSLGVYAPESLAREEAMAMAKTGAAWKPPPDPPPETVNIYPSGSSIPTTGVIHGAAISLENYPDIEREPFWSAVSPSLGPHSCPP